MKDRDPQLKILDIESSQVARFKARWDRIDPELYPVERLKYLTEKSQGTLVNHLERRSFAIAEKHSPNDGNKQTNIAKDYMLGALFIEEVVSAMPGFDQAIESSDLTRFHKYLDNFPGNPYDSLAQVILALAPNLKTLMLRVTEGKEPELKNSIGTGCVEMYSIKLMKAIGSLPPPRIFKR